MRTNTRLFLLGLSAAVAVAVATACGSDSATSPGTGSESTPIVYTLTVDTLLPDTVSATVATQVPVIVHLTKLGVGVSGGIVTWKATGGSGKVSADSTVTDATGTASILWTVGDTVGFNFLAIASFDATTNYTAIGVAGTPSTLARVTSDSASVVAGASLLLSVRVTDRLGNGVGAAEVDWSSPAGQVSLPSAAAGANGGASTVFTTPTTPGTYIVTATLPGHASISFTVVAL